MSNVTLFHDVVHLLQAIRAYFQTTPQTLSYGPMHFTGVACLVILHVQHCLSVMSAAKGKWSSHLHPGHNGKARLGGGRDRV